MIQTARLNDIDPQAWLADVLARTAEHPVRQLDELLPWNWKPTQRSITTLSALRRRFHRMATFEAPDVLDLLIKSAGIERDVGSRLPIRESRDAVAFHKWSKADDGSAEQDLSSQR